ncbi:FkbM family methyltransferase [Gloeobacter morelensis]|uniref:FkbM family methyltransferase n=1 Tax=Gloeobacter morelensis MG652769 TaxID=2781736 RepID=A0ABY3PK53_9CYAN|nr:FkbM family methyltransferase [Gloeobacter morelensis]UFP94004.1 FkbM family methyltransferase [Gloeobacter morelensis MG652769]
MTASDPLSRFVELTGETATARERLRELLGSQMVLPEDPPPEQLRALITRDLALLRAADVVITGNEVNERHGTGVLVRRIFAGCPNILSVRSRNDYGGEHAFGAASTLIAHRDPRRHLVFYNVIQALRGSTAGRVVCIPYYASDALTAIAVKELFGVPLCTYIMDDHTLYGDGIPDGLMAELLAKSSLRLAISPEMRAAYVQRYGLKFWVLPPVVEPGRVRTQPELPEARVLGSRTGVLIGNVWGERWLERLRRTVAGSGLKLDWFASLPPWRNLSATELERDGLHLRGFVPESELAPQLSNYPFAVLPSGTLDAGDDQQAIARLSLPTRVLFLMAASGIPILVLGSRRTAAAGFVLRTGIGEVADYEAASFRRAAERLCDPATQRAVRARAAAAAPAFAAREVGAWLFESLERGEPADDRFERALPSAPEDLTPYIGPAVPEGVQLELRAAFEALRRLGSRFVPDFVLDVGGSSGIWSHTMQPLFPKARFVLVEPLLDEYVRAGRDRHIKAHPEFEWVKAAAAEREGETTLLVDGALYGSSLLDAGEHQTRRTVPVTTLDAVARAKQLTGRGLIKLDVQGAEHLVLEGAAELLRRVDALIIETSLEAGAAGGKALGEMLQIVEQLGFTYADDAGEWRAPADGRLLQKDILFLRKALPARPSTVARN